MRSLVELTLRPDLTVDDETAARILAELDRTDLRRYLGELRRALGRARVEVGVEGGEPEGLDQVLRSRFPGKQVEVTRTEGTGAGVRYRSGDDLLDASVAGYLRTVMQELRTK